VKSAEILRVANIGYDLPVLVEGKKHIKNILCDISFTLDEKKILGITGESGSGKTTMAKIISGLIKPTTGKIFYKKTDLKGKLNPGIQILFQNNGEVLNPFRTIDNVVNEALSVRIKDKAECKRYKQEILSAVDFSESLLYRKGYQLSGGEQQRAALMRLLAVKPELLILDEPFSAQDFESQISFLKLFKDINEKFGTTIICISHDILLLKALVDEVIVLHNGKIIEHSSAQQLFKDPVHPYTRFLLNANNLVLSEEELRKNF
jgi:peptide/nickel transport system ATP-binding protein